MRNQLNRLEDTLAEYYKGAPALPKEFKDGLVKWLPWLSLIGGLLVLWSAWTLWTWGHALTSWINYSMRFYGTEPVIVHPAFGIFAWLALIFLTAEGVLYLLAFPGLRDHKKSGWDYLFGGALLTLLYAIALAISPYGSIGTIIWVLIVMVIALYVLYQIRSYYSTVHVVGEHKPAEHALGEKK